MDGGSAGTVRCFLRGKAAVLVIHPSAELIQINDRTRRRIREAHICLATLSPAICQIDRWVAAGRVRVNALLAYEPDRLRFIAAWSTVTSGYPCPPKKPAAPAGSAHSAPSPRRPVRMRPDHHHRHGPLHLTDVEPAYRRELPGRIVLTIGLGMSGACIVGLIVSLVRG
jgi:hypothetical protein